MPLSYEQLPFSVRVVDKISGEPIPGAVVVASWSLLGGLVDRGFVRIWDVQEAVADNDGYAHFSGFGPRYRRWFTTGDHLHWRSPSLLAYKYGYAPNRAQNYKQHPGKIAPYSHDKVIDWWGKDSISLERLSDDPTTRYMEFQEKRGTLGFNVTDNCMWKKVRHMIIQYDKQMQEGEAFGVYQGGHGQWFEQGSSACGGVEWLRGIRNGIDSEEQPK